MDPATLYLETIEDLHAKRRDGRMDEDEFLAALAVVNDAMLMLLKNRGERLRDSEVIVTNAEPDWAWKE